MTTAAKGATAPILGAFLLVLAAGWGGSLRAAEPTPLAGTVQDTLGNLLSGVEVLFVRLPSDAFAPAAVAHSDRAGRFKVTGLIPGLYRVAALKDGYRTHVGQVDTVARSTLDLVLRPTLGLGEEDLPASASWALRVPRRGMLHDIGTGLPPPSGVDSPLDDRGRIADALRLQLDQLFSLSAGAAQSHPDDTEVRPSETRLMLSSAIGERGSFLMEGRHERLSATSFDGPAETTAARSGDSVNLDLSYETGLDAQLAVRAFFNQTDYEVATAQPSATAGVGQEWRTWGYDASWSMQLDATQRFAVALEAQSTSLSGPARNVLPEATFPSGPEALLANRAVGAHGSYEAVVADGHELQLALRTQLSDWPEADVTTIQMRGGIPDRSSWTVQADAQDTWSVTAPFSLVYGLGYKQALVTDAATLVVPRIGGDVRAGDWSVRALVSYHTVAGPSRNGVTVPFRPADPLGYEVEIELPLVRDVRLGGGVRYAPVQFGSFGYVQGDGGPGEHPFYLTDGNSSVREHRLVLREERGPSRTYLELCDGRVEGVVAPLLPFEGLLPVRSGRQLRYWNGRFGVAYPTVGTDVRVEYRRVEASGLSRLSDGVDSIQETVEMRVKQDVRDAPLPGDWQVLLALRLGTVQSGELETRSRYAGSDSVDALNQRISAGVSVVF